MTLRDSRAHGSILHIEGVGRTSPLVDRTGLASQTRLLSNGLIHIRLTSSLVHLLPLGTKDLGDLAKLPVGVGRLDGSTHGLIGCVESVARTSSLITVALPRGYRCLSGWGVCGVYCVCVRHL